MSTPTVLERAIAPLTTLLPPEELELVIELAVLIANADLHIDDAEQEALRTAMEAAMRSKLAPAVVKGWIADSLKNIRAVGGEAYAARLGKLLGERGVGAQAYYAAALVALSSEGVSTAEQGYLRTLAEGAGLRAAETEKLDADALAARA